MAYTPTHQAANQLEPAVMALPPMAKASGGLTFSFECPWDNVRIAYANGTVTTAVTTEALVITIKKSSTSLYTITTGTTDAIGTQVDGVFVADAVFSRGDTITVTTTDSANPGAACAYLFFERVRSI